MDSIDIKSDDPDAEFIKKLEEIKEERKNRAKNRRLKAAEKRKQLLQDVQRVEHVQLVANAQFAPISEISSKFDLSDPHQFPAVQNAVLIRNNEDFSREFPCHGAFKGNVGDSYNKDSGNETGPRPERGPSRIKSNKPFIRNINELIVDKQPQRNQSKLSENSKTQIYTGNPLDADKPQRHSGKSRETSNEKQITALKRGILLDNEIRKANGPDTPLINYISYALTPELEGKLLEFVKEVVRLQRKMYASDKAKAQSKKRYVLGLSQCRRHILGNQVKLLVIAADHKITREEDTLFAEINKIRDMCVERNVEVMYAFNKRKLGNITKTFCIISCIAVLNCDGIQDQLNAIYRDYDLLKKQTNP